MDDHQLKAEDPTQPNLPISGNGLSSGASAPVVGYSSTENNYATEDLEIHEQSDIAYAPKAPSRPATSLLAFSRHKAMAVSIGVTVAVVLLTGVSILFVLRKEQNSTKAKQTSVSIQDVTLKDAAITTLPSELQGSNRSLLVNGDVVTRGDLKFSDGNFTTLFRTQAANANQTFTLPNASGTICLDSNNCNFVTSELLQTKLGQIVNPTSTTVNGFSDDVTIQGTANQINVNSAGGVLTLSAPQNINTTASVQFGNLSLPATGVILGNSLKQTGSGNNLSIDAGGDVLTFTAGGRSFIFPTSGGAAQTICTTGVTCAAGGGQAVLLAPGSAQTDNTADASIFLNDTGGGNLLQLQSGGTDRLAVGGTGNVTAGTYNSQTISSAANFTGTLAIQGANSLTLGTANTNTGSILFKGSGSANTLTLIGPTSPSTNTLTLPNETGTLCSTGSVCSGYAPSTGGTGYIQNGTTTQSNANFNIQSASSASIGAIIQGASSQTADLFQLRNSAGANLLNISAGGNQESIGYINNASGGIGKFSNRLFSSEVFSNTDFWLPTIISPANMSVTADDPASNPAPNGTQTADKLVSNAANAGLYQSFLASITGNYTFSVWLKTNSGTAPVSLRIDSTGGTPATGTAASFTATTTWQRLSVTQNISGALTAVKPTIILPNNGTTVAAWGAQTVYGTDPQVYVSTLSAPVNTQYNGVASNGTLYASSNEGQPTLILQNELGGYLLQGLNGGTSVLTISSAGALFTSSTVTGMAGVNGGSSTLSTRSLVFVGTALDQVASITTTGGVGTDILIQADNAFCFGGCASGGDITLLAGGGATDGTGGAISITAGSGGSTSGAAGSVTLTGGGATNGTAGSVTLTGGNATIGNGGSVSLQAGTTGGGGANGAINIGTSVSSSGITIGHATGTGTITVGQSTAAHSINIGSANATTGAQTINIGNGTTGAATTVNILSGVGTAGASTINLGNNTRVSTINLGNIAPAAARTTTIAGGNSAVVDTVNIGTGNTTVAGGKTINIGTGVPGAAASNTISIGTGGGITGTVGVTIGSIGAANHTTLIQGGTSNTAGSEAIRLQTHTSGGIAIGGTSQVGTITLGQSVISNTINIGSGNIADSNTQTILIGAGLAAGTGKATLLIGNPNGDSSITLQAGNGGIVLPSTLAGSNASIYLCQNNTTNQLVYCKTTGAGAAIFQNGNTFGATVTIGSNDSRSLELETAGITKLTIDTSGNATLTGNLTVQGTGASSIAGNLTVTGTGTSSFDTNTLYIDAALNRVGIGTSAPGAALEVTGDIYLTKEAARTIKLANSTSATTAGAQLSIIGANGLDAAGGAIAITGGNASATGLQFNPGGAITITGGNGANNQGGAVTVKGGSGQIFLGTAGGPVTLQGGDGSGANQTGGNTSINGGQGTGTANGGSINLQTAPASTSSGSSLNGLVTRVSIRQDGTIGIGTTSPTALLHLIGTQPASVAGSGTNATQVLQVTGGKGGDTSGTTGQTGGTGAVLNLTAGAGGDAPSGSTNGNGGSITLQGGAPGAGAGTAGSYGNLFLQTSGGNVGIGTASLGLSKIVSAVSSSSTSQYQNVAGALGLVNTDQTVNNWVELYFGDDATNNAAAAISTKIIDHTNNYSDLHLSTKSASGLSSKLVVLSAGNVGIGDTTPAALFTVGSGDLFQVNSSGAIAAVVGITTSGNILPNAAGTIDLGSTSAEFNNLYLGDNNGLKLGLAQNATLAYDAATDGRVELAGSGASLFIEDRLGLGVDARTIADEGTAATATLTLEPTSSYVTITCNDANGCDITMSEAASVKDGNTVVIINVSANAVNFADTATVSELAGAYASGQYDSLTMLYSTDRWVELARSNN